MVLDTLLGDHSIFFNNGRRLQRAREFADQLLDLAWNRQRKAAQRAINTLGVHEEKIALLEKSKWLSASMVFIHSLSDLRRI